MNNEKVSLKVSGRNEFGDCYIAEGTPYGTITIKLNQLPYVEGRSAYREANYTASATAYKGDEELSIDCSVEWEIEDWDAFEVGDECFCCNWDKPSAILLQGQPFTL